MIKNLLLLAFVCASVVSMGQKPDGYWKSNFSG
jgi:hypothetical protein